ncbi:MAG: aromatic ring-hydroxylating dioxygenase subunit alpha [Pseudomonadota bacterium]
MADRDPDHSTFGSARCPGVSTNDLLNGDTRDVPKFVKDSDPWEFLGSDPIDVARYTSQDFFEQEKKKMWPKVWQFAARQEELPEPGDTVVYENVGRSWLLVRQDDGSVRAFANVCLHRGRKLRTESGSALEFECPFHGFTWAIDGSLARVPCQWDFEHLKEKDMSLPEAHVAEWQGFIFINESEDPMPLEQFLSPLDQHFKRWNLDQCFTGLWVGKVIHANWKVVSEAFMEAWHSIVTHPQILPFTADANSRYNIYSDHVNLTLTPFGVLSPHLEDSGHDEQFIVDSFASGSGRTSTSNEGMQIPEGHTARTYIAELNRQQFMNAMGYDGEPISDSEMVDAYTYNVFPNFSPWGGFAPNVVYRWRPWPDQKSTLMEVRLLMRKPKDGPMPEGAEMRFLGEDEPWDTVKEWGQLGHVFDQDMMNLPYVQEGLEASMNGIVELGNYQESRIRHFHQTMDKYLAADD